MNNQSVTFNELFDLLKKNKNDLKIKQKKKNKDTHSKRGWFYL